MATALSLPAQKGITAGRKVQLLSTEVFHFTFEGDMSAEGKRLREAARSCAVAGMMYEDLHKVDTSDRRREVLGRLIVDVAELQSAFMTFARNVLRLNNCDELEATFKERSEVRKIWEILKPAEGKLAQAAKQ